MSCSSPFYYFLPVLDIDSWEQGFGVVHGYSLEGICSVAVGRLSVLIVLTVVVSSSNFMEYLAFVNTLDDFRILKNARMSYIRLPEVEGL